MDSLQTWGTGSICLTPPPVCNDCFAIGPPSADQTGGGVNIRGLVLAGGKSSRFGRDKALEVYHGESLLERAVNLLGSVDMRPIVVTRHGADYPFLQCPVLRDKLPEKGPLGGIYTAMSVFKKVDFLVLTCDMPVLTSFALHQLFSHKRMDCLTVFSDSCSLQPFPGIYPSLLFSTIGRKLIQGSLSMAALIEQTSNKRIVPWEGDRGVFLNVNRQEDIWELKNFSCLSRSS